MVANACRKDSGVPQWDANLLMPVLKTSLTIEQLMGDTNVVVNPDNSIDLAYRFPLYHVSLAELVPPYSLPYDVTFKLDSLELPDQVIQQSISLGQIASNAGPQGALIILANGSSIPIPAITNLPSSSFDIDAGDYFESLNLQSGVLELELSNGLPIDIENLSYKMSNKASATLLLQDQIASIPAGGVETRTYDMSGKTIESLLLAELVTFETPGTDGNPVLIDTSDALNIKVTIKDLNIYEATTIWPAQNLINDTIDAAFDTGGETELTQSMISGGTIEFQAFSTIEDSLYLSYRLPKTRLNGQEFQFNSTLPPAPSGGSSTHSESFDFEGYEMDLTGQHGDTTNAIFEIIVARIDSTGNLVHLSLEDSLRFAVNLTDITLRYAEGFLESDTVDVVATETIEAFNKILGGSLDLTEVEATIHVENYAGATARVVVNEIMGRNTRNGQQLELTLPANQYDIDRANWASDPNNIIPEVLDVDLDGTNSNIEAFFELLPNEVDLDADVFFNPGGANLGQTDFMWDSHGMKADLMFRLPLELIASELHLVDTSDFRLGSAEELDRVQSGRLIIDVTNGFPIDGRLEMILMDDSGDLIDLMKDAIVVAGAIDAQGIVDQPTESQIIIELSPERLEALKNATRIRYDVIFSTSPNNQHLTIYSDYSFDLQIKADMSYRLN
jgi:hypothetical protein